MRQRRSFVPRLETLEDRSLPSTLTVLNNLDSGAGSLRDAIGHAKDGDTIVFASSLDGQTIVLTSDQININKSLDIEGPGASLLAISGNDTNRVFNITEGQVVAIAGLTITHGLANGAEGGGILDAGSSLSLANDVLSYNQDLGNKGSSGGGAISAHGGASLVITASTFIGNRHRVHLHGQQGHRRQRRLPRIRRQVCGDRQRRRHQQHRRPDRDG